MPWWGWSLVAGAVVVAALTLVAVRVRRAGASLGELLAVVPQCLALLRDVLRDPDVPRRAKLVPALVVVYLVVPVDLIPDWIPGLGQLDDAVLVAWALRGLIAAAGRDRVTRHWRGRPETLERILLLAGVR